jgi:hypothetical protein
VFNERCVATSAARSTENTASLIVAYSLPRNVFIGPLPAMGALLLLVARRLERVYLATVFMAP